MFLSPFFGGCKDSNYFAIHKVINKKAPEETDAFPLVFKPEA